MNFFPLYLFIVKSMASDLMRQIANFHTIFNVVNTALFIGFVPVFAKFVEKVVPGKEIIIDENGIPEDIKIATLTHKGFADAAIEAAKNYKFSPAYNQGKPVKIKVRLPMTFSIGP